MVFWFVLFFFEELLWERICHLFRNTFFYELTTSRLSKITLFKIIPRGKIYTNSVQCPGKCNLADNHWTILLFNRTTVKTTWIEHSLLKSDHLKNNTILSRCTRRVFLCIFNVMCCSGRSMLPPTRSFSSSQHKCDQSKSCTSW